MAGYYYRKVVDAVPASDSESIEGQLGAADVPQFLGFKYWVSTAGLVISTVTFSMALTWTDIDGSTKTIQGNALQLLGLGNVFTSPVNQISRLSETSPVTLVSTAVGLPLGARISYTLLFTMGNSEGCSAF